MDDVDNELTFDVYYRIGQKNESIKFHIAQCVNGDLDKQTCVKLAYNSCNVACLVIDVVRGRLGTNMLNSLVVPKVIHQVENLQNLLKNEQSNPQVPWADVSRKHFPLILHTMNGFVISPVRFHAHIGLSLGGQPCWANVVFRNNGRKWMCTSCDFW